MNSRAVASSASATDKPMLTASLKLADLAARSLFVLLVLFTLPERGNRAVRLIVDTDWVFRILRRL